MPIELRNIPAGMTVVGDVTGSLEARMQGQERVLRDSTISKKVVALLDLSLTREGENSDPHLAGRHQDGRRARWSPICPSTRSR